MIAPSGTDGPDCRQSWSVRALRQLAGGRRTSGAGAPVRLSWGATKKPISTWPLIMGGTSMAELSTTASGLSPVEHHRHLRRALIASTVGTTIEWYDFLLYGTVTGLVFAKVFFPGS